jgi:hypothetical protein
MMGEEWLKMPLLLAFFSNYSSLPAYASKTLLPKSERLPI